ncbi:MAG TPA: biotin/lipoyl-containing protein [Thermoanaerobaculia bacterium]
MSRFKFVIHGNPYEVTIERFEGDSATVEVNGVSYDIEIAREKKPVVIMERARVVPGSGAQPARTLPEGSVGEIKSPLPGVIKQVTVREGDSVKQGQSLVILEAMKMSNEIYADRDGKVVKVLVMAGDNVLEGQTLVTIGA